MKQILVCKIVAFVLLCILPVPGKSQGELSFDSYTHEDGLPNNIVQVIYQDVKGWVWVGTNQGLSRFDGYGFVNYGHSEEDTTSICGTIVRVIHEDRNGKLLVGTENGGLNIYNREKESFEHPYWKPSDLKNLNISVNDIEEDNDGTLWLGTESNIIKIDTSGIVNKVPVIEGKNEFVRVLKFDNAGKLWAGTNTGLYSIDTKTLDVSHFYFSSWKNETDEIWEIYLDDKGNIWIGTFSNGLFIIDPVTERVSPISLPVIERSQTVRSVVKGKKGNYWIGTRGGLFVYNKDEGTSVYYRHNDRIPSSIINNSVLDVFNDGKGKIWIGTRGGLALLVKSKQIFRNYKALPSDNSCRYLNSPIVHAFWVDVKGRIWIGTEDGGINICDPVTNKYQYLMSDLKKPSTSLSKNCIKAFLDVGNDQLWIGAFLGGINVINLKTGNVVTRFQHSPDEPGSLSDDRVWDLLKDNNNNIWVATTKGIDRFDPKTQKFIHYPQLAGYEQVTWLETDSQNNLWFGTIDQLVVFNPSDNEIIQSNEHSRAFLEDSKGRYWIATLDKGIAQYSKTGDRLRYYSTKEGLPNNQALFILEDKKGRLWISTSNGLSRFDPESVSFQNYTKKDGIIDNQFTYGAGYKTKEGKFIFGGVSGFSIFNPLEVEPFFGESPIVLTEFRVFNKKVEISQDKNSLLKKSISETEHIVLDYHQNVFTIEFAALNYLNSEGNKYSYYLEGFDKGWSEPSTNRAATYTNLGPDNYVLHIKRVVPGAESTTEKSIAITVLPPYWMSVWFKMAIVVIIILLVYLLIKFFIYREKVKNEVVIERMNAKKQRELDMMKLKFFTNISHEIRTPLTLILTPLEKLIAQKLSPEDTHSHLMMIHKNSKQLSRLIDQLLDFRKMESGNLKLELAQGDIVRFVMELVDSFKTLAEEKQIVLKFNTLKKRLVTQFDSDKIEKVINNLLSNAFKFTNEGGNITVNLSLVFDSNEEEIGDNPIESEYVEISVRDTGPGISQANANRIFNRFFQASEKEVHTGAGIGLSYVKELVKLHHGKIFVESKQGKGTKFTFRIPYVQKSAMEKNEAVDTVTENIIVNGEGASQSEVHSGNLSSLILLIVEDNPDVRLLIRSHFTPKYKIYEANNGKEGWKIALETLPDIVISDVLMPEMNGYDLCKKIKKDERTSHIPVLLLTALHSKDHEMDGLSSGADDYITKPFDLSILQTKIDNMLSIRKSLKEKYSGELTLQPTNVVITSPDEKFLQKAVEVIEKNISDPDMDIVRFSKEVGVSRMQLYRKLHALTDMTVKEFIRSIRIKRAAQLLTQNKMTISEIAFGVGFKDLSHFRKCFKQTYGMSAKEYKQKKGAG